MVMLKELHCGICGDPTGLPGKSATEVRRVAVRDGWKKRDKQDLCPDCAFTTDLRCR